MGPKMIPSQIYSRRPNSRMKAIIGGSAGNLVEWYDWYSYAAFALYFSPSFFPGRNLTAQLLNTAGIFAAGFLMRPLGGWVFGSMADKAGRKKAMAFSVLLMSGGSLLIACIPPYRMIGMAAPSLLLLARMAQGFSVGGEYGTSATYLTEMAIRRKRGFYSSFQYVTLIGGQLFALGIQLILQKLLLTDAQLHQWGWRIPFFIGAVLSIVALYIRRRLPETEAFKKREVSTKKTSSVSELLKYPRSVLIVIGLTMGGTLAFYTFSIYMQKFLVNTVSLSIAQSTLISFASLLLFALFQPFLGLLSDHTGRRPLLIAFGICGSLATVPLLTAISRTSSVYTAFFLIMAGLLIVSGYTSINAVVKAELFPAHVRATGVGLPYAVTTAVFGGTAEYIALWFRKLGHENYFYWYVSLCIFISLLVYINMKETTQHSYMKDEEG